MLDKNFFSSILSDFFHRKIVDLKTINNKLYIKINDEKSFKKSLE